MGRGLMGPAGRRVVESCRMFLQAKGRRRTLCVCAELFLVWVTRCVSGVFFFGRSIWTFYLEGES